MTVQGHKRRGGVGWSEATKLEQQTIIDLLEKVMA
jgi:hypothetical protein